MGKATIEIAAKAIADFGLIPRQVSDFYQALTQALKLPEGFTVVGISDHTDYRLDYTITVTADVIPEPFLPGWHLPVLECCYTAFNDGEHPAHTELTQLTIWHSTHDRVPYRVLWPYEGPEIRAHQLLWRLKFAARDLKPGVHLRDILVKTCLYEFDWPEDDAECAQEIVAALTMYLAEREKKVKP